MSIPETASAAAFHELLDLLRDAEATFAGNARGEMDGLSIAQGYRHLTHLLSYAFDLYLEGDAERPSFVPLAGPAKKMLGDNCDSVYCFAPIRGDRAYRIRGRRGNGVYLAFCVYGGKPDGQWSERVVANVSHRDLAFDPGGAFEIVLTPTPASDCAGTTTLVQTAADAVCVISREYFEDRTAAAPSQFTIEAVEAAPPPAPLDDAAMARRLRAVATFVRETIAFTPLPAVMPPNVLGPPMPWSPHVPGWGTPDNIYALGLFKLAPDEALVIEGRSPRCTYWGVQLWNRYMQSLDYRSHRVSLNGSQVALNADGSFRVVVAHQDPGIPNWLQTAGYREGVCFCRWLQADSMPEQPASTVVPLASLRRA